MAKTSPGKKSKKEDPAIASPVADDSWKHESDARTLQQAAEVLSDPERRKNAMKHHKKTKKAMRSVDDLVKYKNEKYGAKPPVDGDDLDLDEVADE